MESLVFKCLISNEKVKKKKTFFEVKTKKLIKRQNFKPDNWRSLFIAKSVMMLWLTLKWSTRSSFETVFSQMRHDDCILMILTSQINNPEKIEICLLPLGEFLGDWKKYALVLCWVVMSAWNLGFRELILQMTRTKSDLLLNVILSIVQKSKRQLKR